MNPWRYRCPNGHAGWRPQGSGYRCEICETVFEALVDTKQGVRADGGMSTLTDLREQLVSQATEDEITIEIARLSDRLRVQSELSDDGLRLWLETTGCEVVDQRQDGSCTVRRGGNDD